MTELELIQALRELIAKASADAPDPRRLAREISRRDQLRIRLLASISIFFWLFAAWGLLILCAGLHDFVVYVRTAEFNRAAQVEEMDKPGPKAPYLDTRKSSDSQTLAMLHGTGLIHHSLGIVAGSVGALFLAALFTVWLVTSSRRATLRQINFSLMELSEQLKQLRSDNPFEKIRKPENS